MNSRIGSELTSEQKEAILERWLNSKQNTIKSIAIEYDCSKHQIHKIINKYLSSKIRS